MHAYRLLSAASWCFFTRHPWQLGLTLLSIALGTAVIIAVDLASQTAQLSFQHSVNALSSPMTHQLVTRQGTIPAEFYRQLRIDKGYRHSSPQFESRVEIQGVSYTLLGIDPLASPLQISTRQATPSLNWLRLIAEPNTVFVPPALGLKIGDRFTSDGRVFTVLDYIDLGQPLLISDLATAQQHNTGLTRIQLKLTEAEAQTLVQQLPPNYQLESFTTREHVFAQMTQAFTTNLLAMSLLAMLVGAFLVYNTMTFSVLRRRASFAIQRMVGVTAQQLFWQLLAEALVLGLLGSGLGVILGVVLGQGLLVLVTQTISDLYVSVQATDLLLSPWSVLKGVAVSLLAVGVATLRPAFEAAHVSPLHIQRRSSLEQSNKGLASPLALLGLGLIVGSAIILKLPSHALVIGFLGLFVLIVGYSLIVPWVLRWTLAVLQQALARLKQPPLLATLAIRGVQANLSRTSLAIIALTVAVSATIGVSIMISSFRSSVAQWLEMTLSSDLYISSTATTSSRLQGTLDRRWLERVQTLPDIAAISTGRSLKLEVAGLPLSALVLNPGAQSQRGFEFLNSSPPTAQTAWQDFVAGKGVLVSEPFAYQQQQNVGNLIRFQTDTAGPVQLPILGVFRDYSATQGMLVLPRNLYERYWLDHAISSIGLTLKPNTDAQAVQTVLQAWAKELSAANPTGQTVDIRSNQAIRAFSLNIFDRTFAITHVLRALVILVAFVGVFSALMALFMEKGREFAILRATGFTPQQLQTLVLSQAALMGLLAGVLALPLGGMMSAILIEIINQRSFGWTMQTQLPLSTLAQAIGLALLAAVLASLYPVKRLGRLSIREGLSET